jgi:hypothetical protein
MGVYVLRKGLTDNGTTLDASMVGVRMTGRISTAQGDKTQETESNSPKGDARES